MERFLGMVGFYRNFIEHFAHISQPLRELTKDDSNFTWTADCEKSFTKLKEPLSKEPILAFPVTNKEFINEVDASNYSIGGILTQEQADGTIRTVAYYSCALSKQQQKWETFSKETYAVVVALRKWHSYLYGNKFVLRSDHNPLVTIRDKKDPRGKIARWLMELEEYEFDIVHLPGKENVKADFMSRGNPTAFPSAGRLEENVYAVVNESFRTQLKIEQNSDAIIKRATDELVNNGAVSTGRLN